MPVTFPHFYNGDNLCDFVFALLHTKTPQRCLPYKERNCSIWELFFFSFFVFFVFQNSPLFRQDVLGCNSFVYPESKFFSFRVDSFSEGRQTV